jgi:hypothetical protein
MNRAFLPVLLAALLTGCAAGPGAAPKPDPFVGWYASYRTCRAEYEAMDARVAAAGVADPQYFRVPGYPYLRTDRVLASFAYEVATLDEIGGWVRKMREFDQEAREFEYRNLGMNTQQVAESRSRFLNCGRTLAGIEFNDAPQVFAALQEVVAPPDLYSTTQRALGFYAFNAPAMRARMEARGKALEQAYRTPVEQLPARAPLRLWKVAQAEDLSLVQNPYKGMLLDELGYPGLTDSQWRALAEHHAPRLWIETASAADEPAHPVHTPQGPTADPGRHVGNFHITFTRFGGIALTQINYVFWFKGERQDAPLDGFIWRVTLDPQAKPLVYESLHASGRDYRIYPVQPLQRRPAADGAADPITVAPKLAPPLHPTLRIAAGTHEILRVLGPEEVPADPQGPAPTYALARYEDLMALPRPEGGTRSLFGPDGIVPGPHADDPIGGLASGIPKPGALRALSRLPVAHVGRRHFDEAFLLESVFLSPVATAVSATRAAN